MSEEPKAPKPNIRNRIEDWFSDLAGLIYENRIKTLVFAAAFAALFIVQLPKITVDTSTEGFLHDDDPALLQYNDFRERFGRDGMIIIALKPPNVFDREFLKKLESLHRDLRDHTPHLEDITSLINARNTRGEKDEIIVEDFLETWPETDADMERLKKRALENVMYENMLLSEDAGFTTIVIQSRSYSAPGAGAPGEGLSDEDMGDFSDDDFEEAGASETKGPPAPGGEKTFLTDAENSEIVRAVEAIVKRHDLGDTEIYIAGPPVLTDFLKRTMLEDMRKFMAIVVFTIAVFLFVMFRRISGVFAPLFVVLLSLVCAVGLMAGSGVALKLPTQILPSFILAVGVGDSVHILVIFFRRFDESGDKKAAIEHALGHSGLAILMTTLTTAGGFLSFSTADVAPLGDLGLFAAAGVFLALFYTLILLPALLSLIPIKPRARRPGKKAGAPFSDRLLNKVANVSIRRPGAVLIVSTVLIVASIAGAAQIVIWHNPMKWLPDTSAARLANEKIDFELKGTTNLEVILDTGRENGLHDPDFLNRLEESAKKFDSWRSDKVSAGKAWSITTVLKETHQALHGNDPAFYAVPQNRDLAAQEFLLFENSGSDDLEDFTDSQFSMARLTIKVPFINALDYHSFIETVEAHFTKTFPDADIAITGLVPLLVRVITSAIRSMIRSYGYAFLAITLLMVLLIGRLRIGLVSMIPNLAPIVVTLGIMGWAGIKMDLFSMLVGSIAIGLAVDDTIHFMHNFRRYFEESGDAARAVTQTLLTTGRAMLVTTCVLSIGFFAFMFSDMNNLFLFGFLTGITIFMALLSDYFIAPALMIVLNRKKETSP
ncbi:RND transporter [Candidatus Desulfarcum epimagneticum]|uniref:RND transporter n=1 Tax=uncultured Desulfobacteraceae bacterium TaxID=218296 RepID=A0A484HFB3_9BACT|nr:RND transporter [uncultured Desulfobacteraceae bacterium]